MSLGNQNPRGLAEQLRKVSRKQFHDFILTSLLLNLFGSVGAILPVMSNGELGITFYVAATHAGANLVAILFRGFFVENPSSFESD